MAELPFASDYFDLSWSEGAIFVIGFEQGLKYWRGLLRPGGYIAVTEATWINDNPPAPIKDYWQEVYPAIDTVRSNLRIIKSSGFANIGHFALPASSWWDDYYRPLLARLGYFCLKYAGNSALAIADEAEREIEFHRRYSDYYGYVFYVMQK